jgi:hypothetical protein
VNEKNWGDKEMLYSKEGKRGRVSGSKKQVTGQLKNREKWKVMQTKVETAPASTLARGGGAKAEATTAR